MDFRVSDELRELRESARAVLARECPPALVRQVVARQGDASGLWKQLVELGWPALAIGEEHGGLGYTFVELAVVIEELGRVAAPGPFLPTVGQFAPAIRELGDDAQRARYLGAVALGERTGTLAVAEGAGWTMAAPATRARRDGDGWALEGTKRQVLEASNADLLVVSAHTDAGVAAFVVERAGVRIEPVEALDASREIADVDLEATRVPGDALLGIPGPPTVSGLERAAHEATTALAIETVGACARILETTVAYAKVREQFGRPIGSFQAVKHALADAFVAVQRAQATAEFAAMTIAEDDPRRPIAASMAKVAAGDCQRLLVRDGIQLHGGIGYTWEHDLHLYAKRAMAGAALLGTAADHRARIAYLTGL